MNRAELASRLAEQSNLTKKDAELLVVRMLDLITEALVDGEKVQLVGFGAFEVKDYLTHQGRDWKTGRPMFVQSSRYVQFRAGKNLKEALK